MRGMRDVYWDAGSSIHRVSWPALKGSVETSPSRFVAVALRRHRGVSPTLISTNCLALADRYFVGATERSLAGPLQSPPESLPAPEHRARWARPEPTAPADTRASRREHRYPCGTLQTLQDVLTAARSPVHDRG